MPANSLFLTNRRSVLGGLAATALAAPATGQQDTAPANAQTLVLEPRKTALRPDAPESTLIAVNGQTPGPTIRIRKGQTLDLTVENKLDQPTALHIHGLRGPNAAEGMPGLGTNAIAPGERRTLRIVAADSGTFLYLPVLAGHVSEQLERGLYGAFVVEEPDAPAVDADHVALLDDIALANNGSLAAPFGRRLDAARFGRLGSALILNGNFVPGQVTARPNARVRLRLVCPANARIMPLKFEGGRQTVVAIDGQACDPFDPLKRAVVLLPGSRYDVMLDLPSAAGAELSVLVDLGSLHKVLIFKTEGEPLPPRPEVGMLPQNVVPPSIRLQNAARAELAISGGLERAAGGAPAALPDEAELEKRFPDRSKIWSINNGFNSGFSGKPVLTVKRGTPVVLAVTNRSPWSQVLTVHGHVFRLLHPKDDGWEPYFLDTIHLPAMTTSRIAFDAVNPGKWAIRSTIAEHYDAGMATWFEVT